MIPNPWKYKIFFFFFSFCENCSPVKISLQDLVKKKMVKLEANPEDAREKFVVEGVSFKKLKKFLGEEGKTK